MTPSWSVLFRLVPTTTIFQYFYKTLRHRTRRRILLIQHLCDWPLWLFQHLCDAFWKDNIFSSTLNNPWIVFFLWDLTVQFSHADTPRVEGNKQKASPEVIESRAPTLLGHSKLLQRYSSDPSRRPRVAASQAKDDTPQVPSESGHPWLRVHTVVTRDLRLHKKDGKWGSPVAHSNS